MKNCCPNPGGNGNHQSWDPYEARARWMLWKKSRGGLRGLVSDEARAHGWTFEERGPSRRAPNPRSKNPLEAYTGREFDAGKALWNDLDEKEAHGLLAMLRENKVAATISLDPDPKKFGAHRFSVYLTEPLDSYTSIAVQGVVNRFTEALSEKRIMRLKGVPGIEYGISAYTSGGRGRPRRKAKGNPPAYFIIDQKTNRILGISRGHPMQSYNKGLGTATVFARKLGRNVIMVVHPYIPPGFKVGVEVTPLFYHYGHTEITPKGEVLRNPLTRDERVQIGKRIKALSSASVVAALDEGEDSLDSRYYAGGADMGREIVRDYRARRGVKENPLTVAEGGAIAEQAVSDVMRASSLRHGMRAGFYAGRADAANDIVRKYGPEFMRKNPPQPRGSAHPLKRLVGPIKWEDMTKDQRLAVAGQHLYGGMPHDPSGTYWSLWEYPKQVGGMKLWRRSQGTVIGENPLQAFDVYLRGKKIDTIFYGQNVKVDVDEVKRSLVGHDGYDSAIRVVKQRRRKAAKNPVRKTDPLDKKIGEAWHRLASGVQVSVMDIPRIFRDVRLEVSAGTELDAAVRLAIARYQVNRNPRRGRSVKKNPLLQTVLPALGNPQKKGRGRRRIVIGRSKRKWSGRRKKHLVGMRAKVVANSKTKRGMVLQVKGSGPEAGERATVVGRDPAWKNDIRWRVRVGRLLWSMRDGELSAAIARGYLISTVGLHNNPPSSRAPFRDGQKISVEKYRAWLSKSGTKDQIEDFDRAVKLQTTANSAPKEILFKRMEMGPKLTGRMALVKYGETDEHTYKAPKGSKKGKSWFRHSWTEGGGKKVPLLVDSTGKHIITPLGKGQVINDWMR
jgi:hypothetical protein